MISWVSEIVSSGRFIQHRDETCGSGVRSRLPRKAQPTFSSHLFMPVNITSGPKSYVVALSVCLTLETSMVCDRVNTEILVALHFLAPGNVFRIDQRPFSHVRGRFVEGSVTPSNKGGSKTLLQL